MKDAVHAEWTKLRSLASTFWLLAGIVGLTVGVSVAVAAANNYNSNGSAQDTTKLSLAGIDLGQSIVAVLAVLIVSNEYSTGMIRVTLAAIPRRLTVLTAKATVVMGVVAAAGIVAVLGSLVAGRLILPAHGFTAAHGYALLSMTHGPTIRAAGGSVLYLVLIALLSLGIATAVRDPATAIGVVLGLLYLPPIVDQVVSDPTWQHRLQQLAPMTAGQAIQTTIDPHTLPIGPWAGLGVLAAWSTTALIAGGTLLLLRDA